MPTAPVLRDRMKFWLFLNVLQNSWNLQELLESPPETCMWNLRQFGEVTIFDGKMPTAPDLQNRMKFWHFLNVLKNSWNLQELLESPPETCMWNLRQFREATIFDGKMPTAPDFKNRMKFWHFLNVLQNSWNIYNLLESTPETCMWNLRQFGEVTVFDRKMPTAPDLQNRMKFWHSLNFLQNSWNLQKLLESPPETCMWNLRQFGEVTIFDRKCRLGRTLETGWNFDFFSMFSKIHETYRSYWNHHQKHACEIWGSSEKLQFLTEKCLQRQPSKQDEILTFSQCSPKFIKLTEVIGITTRNMHVKFEAVWRCYNFWGKNADSTGPSKQDEILTFTQCSPKFMKLTEFIGITTRNMHVKFEAVWTSYNFWRKNAYSPNLHNRTKFWHFLNVLPKIMKLTDVIGITTRNMHVKFEAVQRSYNFWRKNAYSANLQNRMKFWHFLNVLKNSWNLQNLLESPPETCMWNLRQFGEVTIFDKKCLHRRTLKTGWNFDIFSMFSKIHETYRSYWNHHQKHACEIWGSLEKLQFLTEKCLQRRTFKTGWNFDIHSMFSKIHEIYRIYWNHHQKHACEIWGSSEKLQFLTEKCLQRQTSKQDEILTFSQCSQKFMKLTEFIVITTRNMHVKFEAVPKSYNFWRKMPTAPDLKYRMKFRHFLNVLRNSWNLQKLLESPPETCMWNLRQFWEVTIFDGKMPTAPDLQNRMKFWHSLNVLKNSWNLQNLLESPPETCMWNLRQFIVTIFDGKMPTAPTFKTGRNFDIFSMFSKIHEIYRIYWNQHQKHACEIWGSSEKLQFLTEQCLQRQTFKTGWNFDIHSIFSKIHETYRSYWNHHQKHACEIWGSLEKLQFLTEKCLQRRTFKTGWNFDIHSFFSKI